MTPTSNPGTCQSSSSLARNASRPRGFTLVEITVVLVIVAVAVTLLVPHFADRDRESLRRAARGVAGALGLVSETAALGGYPLRLTVNLDSQRLAVEVADAEGKYAPLQDALLQDLLEGKGVRVLAVATGGRPYQRHGEVKLVFSPDGRSDGVRLLLGGAGGLSCEVAYDPVLERAWPVGGEACT
jgi:prepilin-type N-terminal cleavage/methylation domain-containing protein